MDQKIVLGSGNSLGKKYICHTSSPKLGNIILILKEDQYDIPKKKCTLAGKGNSLRIYQKMHFENVTTFQRGTDHKFPIGYIKRFSKSDIRLKDSPSRKVTSGVLKVLDLKSIHTLWKKNFTKRNGLRIYSNL